MYRFWIMWPAPGMSQPTAGAITAIAPALGDATAAGLDLAGMGFGIR
jgi:hypothetical protein